MNTQDSKVKANEPEKAKAEAKVEKAPEPGTVEAQVALAKEVDQGESAEELLAQAQPYVKLGGFVDYSGSPEATTKLRERIDGYFVLKGKK